MEVITTILICTVGFLVYLVNANSNEVLRLKSSSREREFEVQYLLDEKEREISTLKRQFQTEKNKLLSQPTASRMETSSLKEQLDKNRGDIQDLQKKLREKEKIISDLRNINSSLNLKSESELQNLIRQLTATQNDSNEIYILRNKNYELQNNIQDLNKMIRNFQNENDELRLKVKNLENGTLQGFDWGNTQKQKKFVRVIFSKGSNRFFDYLLGEHSDIKVGDFVMVSFYNKKIKKSDVTAAQVIYISGENEFSKNATSKIIGKADYPKW